MFEDDEVIDDGTVAGRLQSILGATGHLVVPGLQTGIDFQDTGFAGNQEPNGPGFRDPHPSSRNQVGHFLTAVGLQFSPAVVSRPIPFFGTIRQMVQAPPTMSDADVALRLTIGHEKAPDPNGTMAAIDVLLTGELEDLLPGPRVKPTTSGTGGSPKPSRTRRRPRSPRSLAHSGPSSRPPRTRTCRRGTTLWPAWGPATP